MTGVHRREIRKQAFMEEDWHADMKAVLRHKRKEPAHAQRELTLGTIFWEDVVTLATVILGRQRARTLHLTSSPDNQDKKKT